MPSNILQELSYNGFLLVVLEDEHYQENLHDILKSVKNGNKICYVCLTKPYIDVAEELKQNHMNLSDFFFVDTLTSHYDSPEQSENCAYVSSPTDLKNIEDVIINSIKERNCDVIFVDTISSLLLYQKEHPILQFTNNLVSRDDHGIKKKIFILLRGDSVPIEECNKLLQNLEMFVDKKIDFTGN
ncbi:MAG: hypothetical protein KKC05_00100 [Nanoarchaeota archaeon]|nr:hypothetical protein [Nanoarchaeota archaeon]